VSIYNDGTLHGQYFVDHVEFLYWRQRMDEKCYYCGESGKLHWSCHIHNPVGRGFVLFCKLCLDRKNVIRRSEDEEYEEEY
jgi:hypothetical protein